jgi:hypothetical protein
VAHNALFGWGSILVGLVAGMGLGLGFHRDDFLGGYGSLRRRMLRLGHIALVALGMLNVLYAQSAPGLHLGPGAFAITSAAWMVGGLAMPVCCALMAWRPAFRPLFAIPVTTLLLAAALTAIGLARR